MKEYRRVAVVVAALIPLAVGCNSILGIKPHPLADGGAAGTAGGAGTGGGGRAGGDGAAGTAGGGGAGGGAGTPSGCSVDGGGADADGADASAAVPCGFAIPNFAPGLPNPASYKVNTDQTVTDNITKLTWEGLVDNRVVPQSEAARYCAEKDSSKGPWRLPTLLELMSLVDFTVSGPGPTISAMFPDRPAQWFWTSSRGPCGVRKGWYVDFARGDAHQAADDDPNALLRVRCVRGAPPNCPSTRYSFGDGGNETVHDATTGLTWSRAVEVAQDLSWSDATAFCPTLGTGWRLPSPAELESIVDLTQQDPAIDGSIFPDTPDAYFWTSAPQASDSNYAWYVAFVHGHVDVYDVGMKWWVRCVRWDGGP
jgi:hypothetical protein